MIYMIRDEPGIPYRKRNKEKYASMNYKSIVENK